jgi:lambda family phage minor tail protein L
MGLERSRDKISKAVFDMEPTAIIELYRIYPNTVSKPTAYINIHNGSVFGGGIYWQGELYSPIPMETEGFSVSSNTKPNRPIMRVSNKDYLITNLLSNNEDFRNAKIERRRTFLKYLDDENFDGGNPWGEPDPNAEITVDFYLVSQKRQENKVYVELEVTSPLDIEARDLTNRKVLAKYCPWGYRGAGCEYKGTVIEREDGKPFTSNSSGAQNVLKSTGYTARNEAIADGRSFLNMENFGYVFAYQNPKDLYNPDKFYRPGHIVYTINDRVRIQDNEDASIFRPLLTYYVARDFAKRGQNPREFPDLWDKDGCGKKVHQCKSRFAKYDKYKKYLENDSYSQQLWDLESYRPGEHQSYIKPTSNNNDVINKVKNLFKYSLNRWGYTHRANQYLNYNQESLYENAFPFSATERDNCSALSAPFTTISETDLNKEFTILLDIPYLGPPQRYPYFLQGEEDNDDEIYEDVDQIILKTGRSTVGYNKNHRQFVLGLQKYPYVEFPTYAPYKNNNSCSVRVHRVPLVGDRGPGDFFRAKDEFGNRIVPESGFDVKNSKNFVFSLRKDVYAGKPRFRANWSCLTYPANEEKTTVFVECQTTFFVKNMHTTDVDRLVLFGGNTSMPVFNFINNPDIDAATTEADQYIDKWSTQDMKVAALAIWDKSLSNGDLNACKTLETVELSNKAWDVEMVKKYSAIRNVDKDRDPGTERLLNNLVFWQKPYKSDGFWYVTDHKNGKRLVYSGSNYSYAGGGSGAFTRSGYDFLNVDASLLRAPVVGRPVTVEGFFGTLHFGGFPGTDGYPFRT